MESCGQPSTSGSAGNVNGASEVLTLTKRRESLIQHVRELEELFRNSDANNDLDMMGDYFLKKSQIVKSINRLTALIRQHLSKSSKPSDADESKSECLSILDLSKNSPSPSSSTVTGSHRASSDMTFQSQSSQTHEMLNSNDAVDYSASSVATTAVLPLHRSINELTTLNSWEDNYGLSKDDFDFQTIHPDCESVRLDAVRPFMQDDLKLLARVRWIKDRKNYKNISYEFYTNNNNSFIFFDLFLPTLRTDSPSLRIVILRDGFCSKNDKNSLVIVLGTSLKGITHEIVRPFILGKKYVGFQRKVYGFVTSLLAREPILRRCHSSLISWRDGDRKGNDIRLIEALLRDDTFPYIAPASFPLSKAQISRKRRNALRQGACSSQISNTPKPIDETTTSCNQKVDSGRLNRGVMEYKKLGSKRNIFLLPGLIDEASLPEHNRKIHVVKSKGEVTSFKITMPDNETLVIPNNNFAVRNLFNATISNGYYIVHPLAKCPDGSLFRHHLGEYCWLDIFAIKNKVIPNKVVPFPALKKYFLRTVGLLLSEFDAISVSKSGKSGHFNVEKVKSARQQRNDRILVKQSASSLFIKRKGGSNNKTQQPKIDSKINKKWVVKNDKTDLKVKSENDEPTILNHFGVAAKSSLSFGTSRSRSLHDLTDESEVSDYHSTS